MSKIRRIGILTSGGDCAGLNAVIKGAAQMCAASGVEACAIPSGYAGLYNLIDLEKIDLLDESRVDTIDSFVAGSAIGNSRVKIAAINDERKYERIQSGLLKFAIDALLISGGDDTGSVVVDLHANNIPCVHAPKTMDLDLHTYSVGGDSAVNLIAGFVRDVRTTGRSHNRVMVVEVFGRYAGHTAFRGGVAADADCILIPEVPVDFDIVYGHMKKRLMRRIADSGTGTYVIVVTESINNSAESLLHDTSVTADAFGHKKLGGSGKFVREQLTARLKNDPEIPAFFRQHGIFIEGMNAAFEVRESVPGYIARSGMCTALDVNFGKDVGSAAVVLLAHGYTGVTVTGVTDGEIQYMNTGEAIVQRTVDEKMVALYEQLGVCFGRNPQPFAPSFTRIERKAWCYA